MTKTPRRPIPRVQRDVSDEGVPEDRPTMLPGFDMQQFARDSERLHRASPPTASPAHEPAPDAGPLLEVAAEVSEDDAEAIYWAQIGSDSQVVVLAQRLEEMLEVPRDAAEGFVLSKVDGRRTVAAVIDASELPRLAALSVLHELLERGVIALR